MKIYVSVSIWSVFFLSLSFIFVAIHFDNLITWMTYTIILCAHKPNWPYIYMRVLHCIALILLLFSTCFSTIQTGQVLRLLINFLSIHFTTIDLVFFFKKKYKTYSTRLCIIFFFTFYRCFYYFQISFTKRKHTTFYCCFFLAQFVFDSNNN